MIAQSEYLRQWVKRAASRGTLCVRNHARSMSASLRWTLRGEVITNAVTCCGHWRRGFAESHEATFPQRLVPSSRGKRGVLMSALYQRCSVQCLCRTMKAAHNTSARRCSPCSPHVRTYQVACSVTSTYITLFISGIQQRPLRSA
jgi:hypothetical protein